MVTKHLFMLFLSISVAGLTLATGVVSRADEATETPTHEEEAPAPIPHPIPHPAPHLTPYPTPASTPKPALTPKALENYEALNLFSEVLHHLRSEYVEELDEEELIYGAVRGMLQELDPHSVFMPPRIYEDMQAKTRGSFAGLGIEVSVSEDHFIQVISPIDDTPASRAGIKARDKIVEICPTEVPEDWEEDCRSTRGMTLGEAVGLMRGKKGTEITILIMREEFDEPRGFIIERDIIKTASVHSRLLEPGYGYVRISSFQERTGLDLRKALAGLKEEEAGPLKGLVLDMRDNPGGLLAQAVSVVDLWLDEGLVVYTKGRVEREELSYFAEANGTEPLYPMVILINAGSASASEIVAGALQDHHRALVLGTQSFGKGSVQTVYRMANGSGVKITTALYYTPAGRSIQEVGIAPDMVVEATPMVPMTPRRYQRAREKDLQGHFTQEDAKTQEKEGVQEEGEDGAEAGDESEQDPQLARSLEVLKSWIYFDRFRDEPALGEVKDEAEAELESAEKSVDDERG